MTEFFYNHECGITYYNQTVLKHHFSYSSYYEPTKFGRSTLRRADYIHLKPDYVMTTPRNYLMVFYALDEMVGLNLVYNDKTVAYNISKYELLVLSLPQQTIITLKTLTEANIMLFACDISEAPNDIELFDIQNTNHETILTISDISGSCELQTNDKPYFSFILDGDIDIKSTKLKSYDAFYDTKTITLAGKAKILNFSMPVPL